MSERGHTPPLGLHALTGVYDLVLGLATREGRWRRLLLDQVRPATGDRIVDIGCGTGTFAIMLQRQASGASVAGIDPDAEALAIARRKAASAGVAIQFVEGFATDETVKPLRPVTKFTCSLVLHQTPLREKGRLLSLIRHVLPAGGELHIADYGEQRGLMRTAFRLTVQALDGVSDTQPHADGILPRLVQDAGFKTVEITKTVRTATGEIALIRAVK